MEGPRLLLHIFLILLRITRLQASAKIPLRAFIDTSETDNATAIAIQAMLDLSQFTVNWQPDDVDVMLGIRNVPPFDKSTVFWNMNNIICDDLKIGFMMMLAGTRTHSFSVYHAIANAMEVPLIDWAVPDIRPSDLPSFSSESSNDVTVEAPFTYSVHPPVEYILLDYIISKGWTEIVYIHDGDNADRTLHALYKLVEDRSYGEHPIELKVDPVRAPFPEEFFRDFLTTFHRSRSSTPISAINYTLEADGTMTVEAPPPRSYNVIVDLEGAYRIQQFLKALEESILVTRHFNYVFANFLIEDEDLHAFRYTLINITMFQVFEPNQKSFLQRKSDYDGSYRNQHEKPRIDKVPPVAALAHDAVLVAAAAANIAIQDHGTSLFRNALPEPGKGQRFQLFNQGYPGVYCRPDEDRLNLNRPRAVFEYGRILAESIRKVVLDASNNTLTGRIEFDPATGLRRNFTATVIELRPGQNTMNSIVERYGWKHSQWPELGFDAARTDALAAASKNFMRPEKYVYKVVTVLVKPFVMLRRATDNRTLEGNERFEGFCVDLLNKLAENISGFQYEIFVSAGNKYGRKQADGSWDGMIGYLLNETADMAVAPLTINQERERVVDFSKPFMTTGISIMIQKPEKQEFSIFSFMQPLGRTIWILTMCSYVGVSLTIFIVSTFSPYEQRQQLINPASQEYAVTNDFSMYNSLWFTLAAFMQQGTDILPRAPSGRIASSCWWFFTLIIVSSYTANLAAFLTLEKMTPPIESVEDLARQKNILYGTIKEGSTRIFFEDSAVPLYRKMNDFMVKTHSKQMRMNETSIFVDTYDQGIERVRKGKGRYAFLLEETTNNYENSRKPCNTMKVGYNLNTIGYGIATKLGNPLRSAINLAVLYLQEKGELKKLENKWWYDRGQCDVGGISESVDSSSLNLSKVAGIFYILSAGMVLAMLTALVEFVFRKRLEMRENAKNRSNARKNLRRDFLSIDERIQPRGPPRRSRSEDSHSVGGHSNPSSARYF